jgi:hypothetical protein
MSLTVWLWIVVGAVAYVALVAILLGIMRAAAEADRWDRLEFEEWAASHGYGDSELPPSHRAA